MPHPTPHACHRRREGLRPHPARPPGYAQTVPAAGAEAPVSSLPPTELRAAAEDDAVRPVRTETPSTHTETITTQRDTMPSTALPRLGGPTDTQGSTDPCVFCTPLHACT